MSPENFAFWLNGFVDSNPNIAAPTPEQWRLIVWQLSFAIDKLNPHAHLHNPKHPTSPLFLDIGKKPWAL